MGNVLKPLAKSVLIPWKLTAAASAADTAIHKKMFRSGFTTLIIKSLKDSGLFIKGISETIKNDAKEQERWFLLMVLGTLGASLLGNLLTGEGTIRAGKGTIRADENFQCHPIL